MEDREYTTYVDGEITTIPPMKKLCKALTEKFHCQEEENKKLREVNKKLIEEVWKDEEVARLKSENESLYKKMALGFPISEKESESIKKWMKEHECKFRGMRIGGIKSYEFHPTEVGTFGYVICSCGEKFKFQEP